MPITLNGSGTVTGLAVGGLPDGTVDADTLAAKAATAAKLGNGSVLQTVYIQKTDTFSSSSGSWVDVTGLTADITMTSSSNKVLVICHVSGLNDATTGSGLGIDRGGSFVGLPQSGY